MNIIYLACGHGIIEHPNITYQDKYIQRDIMGDMLEIDLSKYDIIVASPPCNYYSKALSYRNRESSKYSNETAHLLPSIIDKLKNGDKPFIVENVINKKRMKNIIQNFNGFYYEHGRHSYFTNVLIDLSAIPQQNDNIQNRSKLQRQGGENVNRVFKWFIEYVIANNYHNRNN